MCKSPEIENPLPGYYKLPWLLNDNSSWTRSEFVNAIQSEGVPIDVGFRGFTRRSTRRCRPVGSLLNARIAAAQTVLLHHPVLLQPDDTLNQIARAMAKVDSAHVRR